MAIRVALERLACSQGRLLSHSAAACSGDPRQKAVEMGREEQARVNAQLKRVMPQVLKPPQRSAEQLADAEARSKEYSRLKMAQHKELQRSMRERKFLRDEAVLALPPRLLQAAMAPTEPFPMKVIPPFATPPRAPHWRF